MKTKIENKKNTRYVPIPGYKGIRKDLITKKYFVRKSINGKQYSDSFETIPEAVNWRNSFHPSLTFTKLKTNKVDLSGQQQVKLAPVVSRPNGVEAEYSFRDAWELYKSYHFPSLEIVTKNKKLYAEKHFLKDLMNFKMVEINHKLLDAFMSEKAKKARAGVNSKRYNFNHDLKILKAFFSWYRNNYDGVFVNPVLPRHRVIGTIRPIIKKRKKMTREQVLMFFKAFDSEFWRDYAEFHFYTTARVQEVGGLQRSNVFMEERKIEIVNVAVWEDRNKFSYLKEIPKNGEVRYVYMNSRLEEILQRRLADVSDVPCKFNFQSSGHSLDFVFHINGQPPSYRQVQYYYNKALQKVGLDRDFSSTHIMRKAMANIVRQRKGLDAAQAAGGWKSREIVEDFYTDAPNELNVEAAIDVEQYMNEGNCAVKIKPNLTLVQ